MPTQQRIGLTQAAKWLGITPRALQHWGNRPGAPVAQEGGRRVYLWPAFPRWRDAQLAARAARLAPSEALREARTRREVALASLTEQRLAVQRVALVTAEDADSRVEAILVRVRGHLAGWPATVAPKLVGVETAGEARGILEAGVVALLSATSGARSSRRARP